MGFAFISSSSASVSISFTAAVIRGSDGLPIAKNSIGVLVADTTRNGFASAGDLPGSTLLANATLGGSGNLILQVFIAEDLGGGLIGFNGKVDYNDAALISPGTPLAFYWFPSLYSAGVTISKDTSISYGFYRTDLVDSVSGSDISFIAPADGAALSLSVFDNVTFPGALATPANLTASSTTIISSTPPPITSSESVAPKLVISGSNIYLTVQPTVAGRSYQLQYSDDLRSGSWTDIGSVQIGNGLALTLSTLCDIKIPKRFFRIKLN